MQPSRCSTLTVALATLILGLASPAAHAQDAPRLAMQEPGTGRLQRAAPSSLEVDAQRETAMGRFVRGDVNGALDALNQVGEPRVSSVLVDGLIRTRRSDIVDYLGVHEGDLLTPGRLARVDRRLGEFPTTTRTRLRYDLMPDSAVLHPIVFERDRTPESIAGWVPVGVRAIFTQEARMSLANLTGHSDTWTPYFRWAQGRPRVGVDVQTPAPSFLPGKLLLDASWSRQEYLLDATPTTKDIFEETRSRAGVGLSDWITGWLRWQGGASVDHIRKTTYLGLNGNLTSRLAGDRLSANAKAEWYTAADAESFRVGEISLSARSGTRMDRPLVTAIAGYALASATAPYAVWPSGSSGSGYTALLRAHRIYENGLLTGEAFGRQMVFATFEYAHPIPTMMGASSLQVAGFVDTAQARFRLRPDPSPVHVDIGAGIRANTSRSGSQVRLDVAHGVRDGLTRVSAAYVQPWGER